MPLHYYPYFLSRFELGLCCFISSFFWNLIILFGRRLILILNSNYWKSGYERYEICDLLRLLCTFTRIKNMKGILLFAIPHGVPSVHYVVLFDVKKLLPACAPNPPNKRLCCIKLSRPKDYVFEFSFNIQEVIICPTAYDASNTLQAREVCMHNTDSYIALPIS